MVENFAGGVYVRYRSPYDPATQSFTAATPRAPSVITPTDGHACWTGGSGNYLTSGCEHFGIGVNGSATATAYRWLIADSANPGSLKAAGTQVSIPAPIWNVAPPPQPGGNPVVRAVIAAEPPEAQQQYGDATWVKVFVTESETEVELHHLVTDDPAVPQSETETEIEWTILQAGPPDKPKNDELGIEGEIGNGKKSITRRYEFYEYTGAYEAESHEVLCGGDGSCDVPLPGELGNYIGAQMAAINLGAVEPPTPTPTDTPSPTPTDTPSPTPTATGSATPTATGTTEVCTGNCNGDGSVSIDELITLVNIALGSAEPSTCPQGIPAGAPVDIALLIQAVNHSLGGCSAST